MPAQVRSLESLPDFRAALWEFQAAARQALDMLEVEARHGVEWVTVDRARYWKNEHRKAWDKVSQSKDNLRQARIQRQVAGFTPDCIDEKKAVVRAENYLKTTEQKLHAVQTWSREVQHAWNEFQARFSQTLGVLDGDLPRAVAVLEKITRQLEAYLMTRAPNLEARQAEAGGVNAAASAAAFSLGAGELSSSENEFAIVDSDAEQPLDPVADDAPAELEFETSANPPPTDPR